MTGLLGHFAGSGDALGQRLSVPGSWYRANTAAERNMSFEAQVVQVDTKHIFTNTQGRELAPEFAVRIVWTENREESQPDLWMKLNAFNTYRKKWETDNPEAVEAERLAKERKKREASAASAAEEKTAAAAGSKRPRARGSGSPSQMAPHFVEITPPGCVNARGGALRKFICKRPSRG